MRGKGQKLRSEVCGVRCEGQGARGKERGMRSKGVKGEG